MTRSAGLALLARDRTHILLVHPTRAPWWRAWSIPKGLVEPGESALEAAIRETFEETALVIPPDRVEPTPRDIPYLDARGRTTKLVTWFVCDAPELPEALPPEQLQLAEVDHARLFTRGEAERRILARLLPILSFMRAAGP